MAALVPYGIGSYVTQPDGTMIYQEFGQPHEWTPLLQNEDCALLVSDLRYGLSEEQIAALWEVPLVKDPTFVMYGKTCTMHRQMGFFTDESHVKGYRFSHQVMPSQPMTEEMRHLVRFVEYVTGARFNAVLFNKYFGDDYLSAHSDADEYLADSGVVALSLGGSRVFRVREAAKNKCGRIVLDHDTGDQELMWMQGRPFQKMYTHEIRAGREGCEPRLSITLRFHRR